MASDQALVLASRSDIRRRLLEAVRIPFVCEDAGVDERGVERPTADQLALELAGLKARVVSRRRPGRLVLGCDQVFEFEGRTSHKPENSEELTSQLLALNGREHVFHCAFALWRDDRVCLAEVHRARVRFARVDEAELRAYAATGEGLGCAGGYRLEEGGARFVESIEGSHFTVLGLPVTALVRALRALGELPPIQRAASSS